MTQPAASDSPPTSEVAAHDVRPRRRTTRTRALWSLELRRAVRTHRAVALFGVYAFFGATAAPMARYLNEIVERFGGIQIVMPAPRAIDGIAGYISNANQLGLLVYVMVAASALTVDAQREMAIFMRTRTRAAHELVVPRYGTNVLLGCGAFAVGLGLAWWGTAMLLGGIDASALFEGMVLSWLYLALIGAVVASVGARMRSSLSTAAVAMGIAIVLALVGSIQAVGTWSPSRLLGSITALASGTPLADFWGPVVVSVLVTAALLVDSIHAVGARER